MSLEAAPRDNGDDGKGTVLTRLDSVSARFFSFPVFLGVALLALCVLTVQSRFNDPDLWWHLKVGESIWHTRSIPSTDSFSYSTGGHAWIAHEWLSEVLIYAAYLSGDYSGLMLLLAALVAGVVLATYVLCSIYSGNVKTALVGGLMAWLFGTVGFALRPLMLGNLFLVLEVLVIHLARTRNRRWAWILLPLFGFWVNCHPSWVLGIIVLIALWLCGLRGFRAGSLVAEAMGASERRFWAWIILLCAAMLLVNPIGIKLPLYPFDVLFRQTANLANVSEWRALDLNDPRGMALFGVAGLIFLLVLVQRLELRLFELALLALGTGLALRHHRMLGVFGILAAPLVCRLIANHWEGYNAQRDSRPGNILMMSLAAAVTIWGFPDRRSLEKQVADNNPAGAVAFIRRAGLSGPMLNDYAWGGYLLWALPEQKVFIDGRTDIFDWTGVLAEYGRWATLEEDPARLPDKYGVKYCLLRRDAPMARVLPYVSGWREVYRDGLAIIFAR